MNGQHDHFKIVCKHCDAVMSQCRCPALDKHVALGVCEKCLDKPLGEVLEVVKPVDFRVSSSDTTKT